jgi:hypothetical protein
MTARKPKKHVLSQFMVDDGMQPLDVLMAATRFYLHKGDVASAVRVAETAAMYRHPRYQAVAVQGDLFGVAGGDAMPAIGADGRPAIVIQWNDGPGQSQPAASDVIDGSATERRASDGSADR